MKILLSHIYPQASNDVRVTCTRGNHLICNLVRHVMSTSWHMVLASPRLAHRRGIVTHAFVVIDIKDIKTFKSIIVAFIFSNIDCTAREKRARGMHRRSSGDASARALFIAPKNIFFGRNLHR